MNAGGEGLAETCSEVARGPQSLLDDGLSGPALTSLCSRAGRAAQPWLLISLQSPPFLLLEPSLPVLEVKCMFPQDPQSLRRVELRDKLEAQKEQ